MADYRELHRRSLSDPDGFWGEAARAVSWFRTPRTVFDGAQNVPFGQWFADGSLNTCFNALDRHVAAGRGDDTALIYDSPLAGTGRSFTYIELLEETAQIAGSLRSLGVGVGDRVLIYLPMIPEAVVAMLACARIGAVHSVVFGGFAPAELAGRIDDATPSVIITASCGLEPTRVVPYLPLLDAALEAAGHEPAHIVVVQRPEHPAELTEQHVLWSDLLTTTSVHPAECVPLGGSDPLYILYTSGTTGRPKGVVRDNGGHAVALTWSMRNLYGIDAGDVMFTASDVGWVVGHSYIVYAPLFVGATTVLYEGKPVGTPDAGAFWRLVAEHHVNVLFTAPTAIRAVKKADPDGALLGDHDLSSLRALFLAGERLDPDTYDWLSEASGKPVVDHWWQTETGWAIAGSPLGVQDLPRKPGSTSLPMPGYDVSILAEDGTAVPDGEEGSVGLRLPLPPGTLTGVWGRGETDQAFTAVEGFYVSGDGGYLDDEGYLFVLGRVDDVMNVAGHRLSSGQIEAAVAAHPAVAECAAIGVPDPVKGQVPRVLVVLKSGAEIPHDRLGAELIERVRATVGPIATPAAVDVVAALPKTRSGKVLRRTMRQLAEGTQVVIPSTIEDPAVLDALRPVLAP